MSGHAALILKEQISNLRIQAKALVKLACMSKDDPVATELEVMSINLMRIAASLEQSAHAMAELRAPTQRWLM